MTSMSAMSVFNADTAIPSPAVTAIYKGLTSLGASANRIAERIRTNPADFGTMMESGKALQEQLGKLIESAEQYGKSANELRTATEATVQASNWIDGNFRSNQCAVANSFGNVVGSFDALQ